MAATLVPEMPKVSYQFDTLYGRPLEINIREVLKAQADDRGFTIERIAIEVLKRHQIEFKVKRQRENLKRRVRDALEALEIAAVVSKTVHTHPQRYIYFCYQLNDA